MLWFSFAEFVVGLEGLFSAVFGADAHGFFARDDKDFAVTNFAGLGRADDRLGDFLHALIRDDNLQFDLGEKIDGIFAAPR